MSSIPIDYRSMSVAEILEGLSSKFTNLLSRISAMT